MRECQECGRWAETEAHHKIPKGRDKRGWGFPGNLIDLCWDCHHGLKGPHKCRSKSVQYMREVRTYLWETLTEDYYLPETLAAVIKMPLKQAYKVTRLLKVYDGGYRQKDVIFRLLGDRYDWIEKNAV